MIEEVSFFYSKADAHSKADEISISSEAKHKHVSVRGKLTCN